MRFLYRQPRSEARVFHSKQATTARKAARAFYDRPATARAQERHGFDVVLWARFTPYVTQFFERKCAHCETPLPVSGPQLIDHFRPTSETMDTTGTSDPGGYWWLAHEWTNLYAVCETCLRNKHTRFPLAGPRAKRGTRGRSLGREHALLIDPCFERPNRCLRFDLDGTAKPVPTESGATPWSGTGLRVGRRLATIEFGSR